MKRNIPLALGMLMLLLGAVAVGQFSAPFRGILSGATRTVLAAPFVFLAKNVSNVSQEQIERLSLENARLKAELLFFANEPRRAGSIDRPELLAKVHSTYPLNSRGLLTLNAGADDGVAEGMPVTVDGFTFLGAIQEVGDTWSVVKTIFDTDWQIPVKIGSRAADGLFVGGRNPRLTLIVKSGVVDGDPVYTAGKDFPYGLKIGEVQGIGGDPGSAFQDADIQIGYDANLPHVLILL